MCLYTYVYINVYIYILYVYSQKIDGRPPWGDISICPQSQKRPAQNTFCDHTSWSSWTSNRERTTRLKHPPHPQMVQPRTATASSDPRWWMDVTTRTLKMMIWLWNQHHLRDISNRIHLTFHLFTFCSRCWYALTPWHSKLLRHKTPFLWTSSLLEDVTYKTPD